MPVNRRTFLSAAAATSLAAAAPGSVRPARTQPGQELPGMLPAPTQGGLCPGGVLALDERAVQLGDGLVDPLRVHDEGERGR